MRQEFFVRGVQAQLTEVTEVISDNVSFLFCFFSPQLIFQFYRGGPMVYLKKNYNFLRFQRGSNIFQGGGGGGGVQLFPGGSGGGGGGGSKC